MKIIKSFISLFSFSFLIYFVVTFLHEQNIFSKKNPVEIIIKKKHCKSHNSDTSYALTEFRNKTYYVGINNCKKLNIGKNNLNFYYDDKLDEIIYKDYFEIKHLLIAILIVLTLNYFIWSEKN